MKNYFEEAIFTRAENKQKKTEKIFSSENINWEMTKIVFSNVNICRGKRCMIINLHVGFIYSTKRAHFPRLGAVNKLRDRISKGEGPG